MKDFRGVLFMKKFFLFSFFVSLIAEAGQFDIQEKCGPEVGAAFVDEKYLADMTEKIKCLFKDYPEELVKDLRERLHAGSRLNKLAQSYNDAGANAEEFFNKFKSLIPDILMRVRFNLRRGVSVQQEDRRKRWKEYSSRWRSAVEHRDIVEMVKILTEEVQDLQQLLGISVGERTLRSILDEIKSILDLPTSRSGMERIVRIITDLSESSAFRKRVLAFQTKTKNDWRGLVEALQKIRRDVEDICNDFRRKIDEVNDKNFFRKIHDVDVMLMSLVNPQVQERLTTRNELETEAISDYFTDLREKINGFKEIVGDRFISQSNLIDRLHNFFASLGRVSALSKVRYDVVPRDVIKISYSTNA